MNVVIASGKGGTGKTLISTNLAYYIGSYEHKKLMLLDCDVEAPNDNLFINASFTKSLNVTVKKPSWDNTTCSLCGKCSLVCNYNAIAKIKDKILIFNELCHSCGACIHLCPSNSLKESTVSIGKIDVAENNIPFLFAQGILNIGESLAPIVIKKLKETMIQDGINLIDASPGTTCPVVKSMEGMDCCLLVTEPTPFGLHDLILAASLSEKLKIPTGIIINRSYGSDDIIENFAIKNHLPIIAKIPFREEYAKSYSKGDILINKHPELIPIFKTIYQSLSTLNSISQIDLNEKPECPLLKNRTVFKSTKLNKDVSNFSLKELVVISGKGGTGKTTITSALGELMQNKIMADNDVDASNLHLLFKPITLFSGDFVGGKKYIIDKEKCTSCGDCINFCHFDAIKTHQQNNFIIDSIACEGCGFCFHICKDKAISAYDAISGKWFISKTNFGELSHAKLGIGEENSGKLVSLVRNKARELAEEKTAKVILSDGPPGMGCSVISSITGVDLALIVTEPSVSGVHDMIRALELTKCFNVKAFIIVNKFDLNKEMTNKISEIGNKFNTKIIAKIPFDKNVNDSLVKGVTIITHGKGPAYEAILDFWKTLEEILK